MSLTYEELLERRPEFKDSILTCYRGSQAHNTYVPNSDPNSIDDIDVMAISVPTLDHYFGLQQYGSRGTKEFWEEEWDCVCYEVMKFMSLLEKGNPNVLSQLWCRDEDVLFMREEGHVLRRERDMFTTKQVYHSFLGYAHSQLKKMTATEHKGYMGEKRKKLVEKFGYDCKNASHLIRLLTMGYEFVTEKELRIYREDDAQKFIDIKTGKWTLDEVKKESQKLFDQFEKVESKIDLPDKINRGEVNDLLMYILKTKFELADMYGN